MPEQVSPSGDDWASTNPGRGAPPPGSGSSPWSGSPTPPSGNASGGWDTGWNQPNPAGAGPATGAWGAGPAAAQGHGGAPPQAIPGGTGGASGPVHPPTSILLVGLVLPLASTALFLTDGLAAHVIGWLIAIFGSIGALAAFTVVDLRRRSSGWYVDRPGLLAGLRVAVLLTGLIVATGFAYLIADAVARWDVWF